MTQSGPRVGALGLCLLGLAAAVAAGCVTTRVTQTPRSGFEQQLLVRSLERAVARLDVSRFAGKRVAIDLYALTRDQAFAKEFVSARLEQRGVQVARGGRPADLRLTIFAPVLSVDRSETLVGIPSFVAPVVGVPFPELALFKWVRNRGHSEVEILAYDPRTDQLVDQTAAGVGRAKYDQFTVLFLISFTSDDLNERPASGGR